MWRTCRLFLSDLWLFFCLCGVQGTVSIRTQLRAVRVEMRAEMRAMRTALSALTAQVGLLAEGMQLLIAAHRAGQCTPLCYPQPHPLTHHPLPLSLTRVSHS